MRCHCAAPALAHVNLLLTLYGGASLATAARLKWDPSTYLAARELFPVEYRAAAGAAALLGAALLLLPHLAAAAAASADRARRAMLYVYAGAMALLVVGEVALVVWLWLRVEAWLASEAAQQMQEALELREHLKPVLQYFSRWHPLPQRIEELIQEAEADAPRNLYVFAGAAALLLLLQPLGAALALCAARERLGRADSADLEDEKAPLRSAYKNGRIVLL